MFPWFSSLQSDGGGIWYCGHSLSNVQGRNLEFFSKTKFTERNEFLISKNIVSIFGTQHHWSIIVWGSATFRTFQAGLVEECITEFDRVLGERFHITLWTPPLMLLPLQLGQSLLLLLLLPQQVLRCHNTAITPRMMFSINEDHLIAWLAVELLVVFIKSGRIQTLATLLALDALFMEWCSVNCHEGLS